jgi:hypothetical protein
MAVVQTRKAVCSTAPKVIELPTAARIDLGASAGVASRILLRKIACFRRLEQPDMSWGVPFELADQSSVGPAR